MTSWMRFRRGLGVAGCTVVVGTVPALAPAQGMQDSVPRVLVEALIAPMAMPGMPAFEGGRPRLIVGRLPSGLAQRLWVPPGATVMGGIESSGAGVAILRSSLPEDSLVAAYRREQLTRGWTTPRPRTAPTPMSGFAPAAGSPEIDLGPGLAFCSGGTLLNIEISTRDNAREIRANAISIGQNLCALQVPRPDPVASFPREQQPVLNNPPGSGDGSGRTCARWSTSAPGGTTRLATPVGLDQILSYYGRQLADSGWTPDDGRQFMTRTWSRRDSTGAFHELTLTAQTRAVAPTCVEVEMRVLVRRP